MKRFLALFLVLTILVGLTACGGGNNDGTESTTPSAGETDTTDETGGDDAGEDTAPSGDGLNVAVNIASEPETIDPALNSAVDGAVMVQHVFEGLMRWDDDGNGNAVLANGQMDSFEKVVNDDGTVLYKIVLRDGIKWSDGQDVVAGDFVYGLRRLVDPETAADYNYMADMIVNANEIMEGTMDKEELGAVAVDDKNLELTLTYDCPYFMEILAFPALLPVREDIITEHGDQWTFDPETYVGNGAMKMSKWEHQSYIEMVPSETYYDQERVTVDTLRFALMDDANAILNGFRSGELDFIEQMPVDEIKALKDSGELVIVDYVGTYYATFNNTVEPFDDVRVREAFGLVIDRNYIVNEITQTGEMPATGYVPAGVYDAKGASGDDFRTVGGDYFDASEEAYEANCEKARELLAEAGYPDGEGFPVVEYMYNTDDRHKAIGEALQNMWQDQLGVTVNLANQEWGVFLDTRKQGDYQIARNGWIADYNDPISFLDMWMTGGGNNDAQYSNPAFDEAIQNAKSTAVPEERMQFMHEAEDILMGDDYFSSPIYFYTQKYMLNPDLDGLYYTPLGYFFFMSLKQK